MCTQNRFEQDLGVLGVEVHPEISFIRMVLMQWESDQENSKRLQLTCRIWLHLPLPLPHAANLCPAFRGYLKGHLLQEALLISFTSF